jgi:hypothetical protein
VSDTTDLLIDAAATIGTMEADKLLRAGAADIARPDLVFAVVVPKVKAAAKLRGVSDKAMVGFLTMGAIIAFGLRVSP